MPDIVFLAASVAFFFVFIGMAYAFEKLREARK